MGMSVLEDNILAVVQLHCLAPANSWCFLAQDFAHVYNGKLFLPAHLPGCSVFEGPSGASTRQAADEAGTQL